MFEPPPKPELVDSEWALSQTYLHHQGKNLSWIQERRLWLRWRPAKGWIDDAAGKCLAEIQKLGVENWVRVMANGSTVPAPTTGGRHSTANAALKSSESFVASSLQDWDVNPELIGVDNAMVINLRTGDMRPMTREDRIRQQVPCIPEYNVPENCRWREFLKAAVPDPMTREYVLRLAGYSLTGYSREHVIPFFYGDPRTGKSTLYNAIREAMGGYATVSSTSNYQKQQTVHKTFYAKLANTRAVFMDEIPRGYQLNEGLVKSITGGELLEANFMRGNAFEFQPRFCMWMIGNNAPTMSERDGGLLARIKVIPFKNEPAHKDKTLPDALKGDQQKYIVADLVIAAAEYLEGGLGKEPLQVQEAVKEYAATADTLSLFLAEVIEPALETELPRKALWEAYKSWTDDARQKRAYGKNGFFRALREGGYRVGGERLTEEKSGADTVFKGIELKSAFRHYT